MNIDIEIKKVIVMCIGVASLALGALSGSVVTMLISPVNEYNHSPGWWSGHPSLEVLLIIAGSCLGAGVYWITYKLFFEGWVGEDKKSK